MTNHYYLTGTEEDPEPKVADFMIEVRGPDALEKVREIIEDEGWEEAANHVCWYCGNFIEDPDGPDHGCGSMNSTSHRAPI